MTRFNSLDIGPKAEFRSKHVSRPLHGWSAYLTNLVALAKRCLLIPTSPASEWPAAFAHHAQLERR